MLGSEVVNKHVYNVLRVRPAITNVVGNRITPEPVAAADKSTPPYLLHYAQDAPYDQGPITTGEEPSAQTIRYVVLFVDQAETDTRIRPAARDAERALVTENAYASGLTLEDDPNAYQVSIGAMAEWPQALGTDVINGIRWRRKGFYLTVNVSRV